MLPVGCQGEDGRCKRSRICRRHPQAGAIWHQLRQTSDVGCDYRQAQGHSLEYAQGHVGGYDLKGQDDHITGGNGPDELSPGQKPGFNVRP